MLCATVILGLVLFGRFISDPDNVILYFYSQPIMLDFCLGMILASLRDQILTAMRRIPVLPWLMLSFGIVSLLTASSLLPIAPSFYAPSTNTFVTFGLPAALIAMAAIGLDDVRTRGQPWQCFQEIGDASYSHLSIAFLYSWRASRLSKPHSSFSNSADSTRLDNDPANGNRRYLYLSLFRTPRTINSDAVDFT